MHIFHKGLCRVLLLLSCVTVVQAQTQTTAEIQKHINGLIRKRAPQLNVGIKIVRLADNQVLYSRHANRSFVPASNQKVYTDAAALLYLGPNFRFQTTLLTTATHIQHGMLKGDVFIKLSGDPDFKHEHLLSLFRALKDFGVKRIVGNVFVDASVFKDEPHSPGSSVDDTYYGYGTGKTPVIIDQNAVGLSVNAASRTGQKAKLVLVPENPYVHLHNQVITLSRNDKNRKKYCFVTYRMQGSDLTVTGCVSPGQNSVFQTIAIADPDDYLHALIRKQLTILNIHLTGKVMDGQAPEQTRLLAIHRSVRLQEIIKTTLKTSNNVFADAVFLKLGAVYFQTQGTWALGAKAVEAILHKNAGLNFEKDKVVDGSGLSRYNRMTPGQMTKLLVVMYHYFPLSYEFIDALPKSGGQGSLDDRMDDTYTKGWVRAKTGTLSSVTSLSGYVMTKDHNMLAFAFFSNGYSGGASQYKQLEDAICAYLSRLSLSDLKRKISQPIVLPNDHATSQTEKSNTVGAQEFRLRKYLRKSFMTIFRTGNTLEVDVPLARVFERDKSILKKPNQKFIKQLLRSLEKATPNLIVLQVMDSLNMQQTKLTQARVKVFEELLRQKVTFQKRALIITQAYHSRNAHDSGLLRVQLHYGA